MRHPEFRVLYQPRCGRSARYRCESMRSEAAFECPLPIVADYCSGSLADTHFPDQNARNLSPY